MSPHSIQSGVRWVHLKEWGEMGLELGGMGLSHPTLSRRQPPPVRATVAPARCSPGGRVDNDGRVNHEGT